jgi:hypothetical protein
MAAAQRQMPQLSVDVDDDGARSPIGSPVGLESGAPPPLTVADEEEERRCGVLLLSHDGVPEEQNDGFERWVRRFAYRRRSSVDPGMQKVKSRLMHACSSQLLQSFLMLLVAVASDYKFGLTLPFRRAALGLNLPTIMYIQALAQLGVGLLLLYAWFRKQLLKLSVVQTYVALRALDMGWVVYLLLAVLVDFDSTPYERAASGLPGGALLIYVVTIVLCCFCLGSSWVKLRKLRVEYRLWRRSAFAAFLAAAKGDDLESRMALNISPNGTATVLPHMHGAFESISLGQQQQQQLQQQQGRLGRQNSAGVVAEDLQLQFASPTEGGNHYFPHAGSADVMAALTESARQAAMQQQVQQQQGAALAAAVEAEAARRRERQDAAEAAAGADPDVPDRFARIGIDEFRVRWNGMAESGRFERSIARLPSDEQVLRHLTPRGFQLVHADVVADPAHESPGLDMLSADGRPLPPRGAQLLSRLFVFSQSRAGSVFLIEFMLDPHRMAISATFKSQDAVQTHNFLSRLELHLLLH